MVSDDNMFFETKRDFAKDMVTGFIRLNGMTVGAVANCSEVYNEEGEKEENDNKNDHTNWNVGGNCNGVNVV